MALPTSGALSLNAIHVEAGGTTGTTCSLNDTDIRGLTPGSGKTINSTQGTTVDFDDFYGASSGFSMTLTVGDRQTQSTVNYVTTTTVFRGYEDVNFNGNLSPTSNSGFFGGANITRLRNAGTFTTSSQTPVLRMQVDQNVANNSSAFSSLKIGNAAALLRSNATYASGTNFASWQWTGSPVSSVTILAPSAPFSPFDAENATQTVVIS